MNAVMFCVFLVMTAVVLLVLAVAAFIVLVAYAEIAYEGLR